MKKKFISLIKFSLDLFLYRTLHTGLKICNFINFISHFSFHEKSARFLTMHKKICSVSETKLMSQRLIFVISVANGNITEIIFVLKASWACLPHHGASWKVSLTHLPSKFCSGCFNFHLAMLKALANIMSAVASGCIFRECFLN